MNSFRVSWSVRVLVVLCLVAAAPAALWSQNVELPSVVIEGTLPSRALAEAAGATSIDASTIAASAAQDLPSLLSSVSGVRISPTGSAGALATISLRGSSSNQVLVLVDGVRVTDPSTGQTDLSRLAIPLDQIERIDVQRGALSAQYGADAVGGVIHIHTKAGATAPSVQFSVQNSSYLPLPITTGSGGSATVNPFPWQTLIDGQTAEFSANMRNLSVWAKADRAANAYPYYDATGIRRQRENSELLEGSGGMQGRVPLAIGEISASMRGEYRSLGVAGTESWPTLEAHQNDWRANAALSFRTDAPFGGALSLELSPYAQVAGIEYRASSSTGPDTHTSLRAGADSVFSWLAPWQGELKGGVSFRYDRLDSSVVKLSDGGAPQRFSGGIFLEPRFEFGKWTAIPALRYDVTNDFPSGFSASLGVLRDLAAGTVLRTSVSSAYRAPSFDDLYWPADSWTSGNTSLKPESSYSADIAIAHRDTSKSWSIGAFGRYTKDIILWQPDSLGVWKPTNYGNALYPGIEAEASAKRGAWELSGNYTFLYSFTLNGALTLADDARIPYVPVHSASLSAIRSSNGFDTAFLVTYSSLKYTSAANTDYLPSTFIANIRLNWLFGASTSFEINFQNFFDERYYIVSDYPMPGFSMSAKLTVRIEPKRTTR